MAKICFTGILDTILVQAPSLTPTTEGDILIDM